MDHKTRIDHRILLLHAHHGDALVAHTVRVDNWSTAIAAGDGVVVGNVGGTVTLTSLCS